MYNVLTKGSHFSAVKNISRFHHIFIIFILYGGLRILILHKLYVLFSAILPVTLCNLLTVEPFLQKAMALFCILRIDTGLRLFVDAF